MLLNRAAPKLSAPEDEEGSGEDASTLDPEALKKKAEKKRQRAAALKGRYRSNCGSR